MPVEGEAGAYCFPQLEISGADPDRPIKSLTVQFTTAVDAADAIELPGDSRFAANAGNKAANRTLNCEGGATADEWQDYLRGNLKVKLASGTETRGLRIVAGYQVEADTYDYNSENGHYYLTVKTPTTWTDALEQAESAPTYMGLHPYLVTITSQQEQDFVYSLINTNCWMGGTDDDAYASQYNGGEPTFGPENHFKFYWVSGPEKGQLITEGKFGNASSHVSPGYANWYTASQEPNNNWLGNIEKYLLFYAAYGGKWNDLGDHGRPVGNVYYVIEYGGMPEDEGTNAGEEWAKIDVRVDPSGSTLSSYAPDVEVGEPVKVVESVNGDEDVRTLTPEGSVPADIERTFYAKDPDAPGGWRELGPNELVDGAPVHAGDYKVVSEAAKEVLPDGSEVPYAPAEAEFSIVPKAVDASGLFAGRSLEKVYDGEATADASGLEADLSFALPGADVEVAFDAAATLDDLSVVASKATVTGVRLSGSDAGDYLLEGLDGGSLEVPARVLPRELTVRAIPSVVWGRTGLPLADGAGQPIAYRSDLAVYPGTGGWAPNMLAPRDGRTLPDGSIESILGQERFDVSANGRALDASSPEAGLYAVSLAYSAVHGPAKGRAVDASLGLAGISASAADVASAEGAGGGASAMADGDSSAPDAGQGFEGFVSAQADGGFDAITPSLIGGGRWDLGNYVLTLVDGSVAVADDPAAQPSSGVGPSPDLPRLPGFLEASASEPASPEKPPLSAADAEKVATEKSGAEGPATSVAIYREGEEASEIDRTAPGTWTVVATYPDPDGGQDRVVRLTYTLTEPSVVVADDEVELPYDPEGKPVGPKDTSKDVGEKYGDKLPEGSDPDVRIERGGKPVGAVDPSVPGVYEVTLTYKDPEGGPDRVVLRTYRVPAPDEPAPPDGPSAPGDGSGDAAGNDDGSGAGQPSPLPDAGNPPAPKPAAGGILPVSGDAAPLAAALGTAATAALVALAAALRRLRLRF